MHSEDDILPDKLIDRADKWTLMIIDFYRQWVASDCPTYFERDFETYTRLIIRDEGGLKVFVSLSQWRPYEQRRCWTMSKPWGGVLKHPTMWFIEVVGELLASKKEQQDNG